MHVERTTAKKTSHTAGLSPSDAIWAAVIRERLASRHQTAAASDHDQTFPKTEVDHLPTRIRIFTYIWLKFIVKYGKCR